jgi:ferrous iron transport protein B
VATLAVVRRETGGWVWPGIMFAYMLALAYLAAFIVYRIAAAFGLS